MFKRILITLSKIKKKNKKKSFLPFLWIFLKPGHKIVFKKKSGDTYSEHSIIRTLRENGRFVKSRVCCGERFSRGLLSQGKQTLVRHIESLYYLGLGSLNDCCAMHSYLVGYHPTVKKSNLKCLKNIFCEEGNNINGIDCAKFDWKQSNRRLVNKGPYGWGDSRDPKK